MAARSMAGARRTAYTDVVIEHYENPKNVGSLDKKAKNVGTGKLSMAV